METLHPSDIELGLERIRVVADRLGIQKTSAKVITVAGTNGKGSCVATLERILVDSGYNVASYTSPHIHKYNERVKISGRVADDKSLCDAFAQIDAARGDISLTYFEFGTLAAFILFAQHTLDFWLLEVGLGGRLDAVNLMSPDIAVITSIALDHQAWLGDTREEIAGEKLGILRDGIPCVCAEPDLTQNMRDIFQERRINTYLINHDFSFSEKNGSVAFSYVDRNRQIKSIDLPKPNMPLPSIAAAFQVLSLCDVYPAFELLEKSLSALKLPGRFQLVETERADIILDVAHNPAACALLAKSLSSELNSASNTTETGEVIAVVAMMRDKQLKESLAPLCACVNRWYVTQFCDVERSATTIELESALRDLKVDPPSFSAHDSVESSLEAVWRDINGRIQSGRTTVLVFGSFLTVAAGLSCLTEGVNLR